MEKVLHRFTGCCVLQNIPFFKWLFLNDPQLKVLPFTLGSLSCLHKVEQDLSFVLGNSINPASIELNPELLICQNAAFIYYR